MNTIACPHCGADNPLNAAFCTTCGKALPDQAAGAGPRIVEGDAVAGTSAGRSLQEEELRKQAKRAAGALLAVAILQWVFGAILLFAGQAASGRLGGGVELNPIVYAVVFGIGVIFFVLFLWARRNPLPAAITGLVLFVSVHLLDAVADPSALVRGIIVKIIIVVVLARAIAAGVRHRKLRQEMQFG